MLRRSLGFAFCLAWIASIASSPAGADETYEVTLTHEEEVGRGASVRFENLLGSIVVRAGGDTRTLRVEVRVVGDAATPREVRDLVETVTLEREETSQGTAFRVGFPVDRHTGFRLPRSEVDGLLSKWVTPLVKRNSVTTQYSGRSVQVGQVKGATALAAHVKILLPMEVDASFSQIVGTVHAASLRGNFTLESLEGGARAEQIYGSLSVRTAGGSIEVSSFNGDRLDLQSGSGNMELIQVRAEQASIHSSGGLIQGREIQASTLKAETDSGNVKLDNLEPGAFEVSTRSGAVDLGTELKRTREASIRSVSGDVTLRVGKLAPFEIQADTGKGSVKSKGVKVEVDQLEKNAARFQRGRGGAALTIHTDSGEITLRSL